MTQQTAVEWLAEQLKKQGFLYDLDIEAAKQMEREQIITAQMDMFNHINNRNYGTDYLNIRDAALKYAEDYATRLQNETN